MRYVIYAITVAVFFVSACSSESGNGNDAGNGETETATLTADSGDAATSSATPTPPAATASPAAATATPEPVPTDADLTYASAADPAASDRMLDVYAPGSGGGLPVIVSLPGGNQARGDASVRATAAQLSGAGYVVFVADHALRGTPSALLADEGRALREGLEDIRCALRFAASEAADYGGDSSEITILGQSAGGFGGMLVFLGADELDAALAAFASARDEGPQTSCVASAELPAVNGFVGFNGAYFVFQRSGLQTSAPDLWPLANPRDQAAASDRRVRMILGGQDQNTPSWHIEEVGAFAGELVALGYDASVVTIEAAGHNIEADGAIWEQTLAVIEAVAE